MDIIPAMQAPEFKEITGWANSPALSLKALKGKVVLLDCWTYTCIFCLRTIPIMRRLHQKYAASGLQVVQAHSYEYQFATEHQNIVRALEQFRINEAAVAFDTKNKTWEAYGNSYWPKHVLIDANGLVRYEHAGYGTISEFESAVVELLEEAGHKLSVPLDAENPADEIFDTYGMHFQGIAPEICVGYSRMRRFGNNQTLKPDVPETIMDSGEHNINVVYLRGKWIWAREGVMFAPGGKEQNPAVIMRYSFAKRVHAIMGSSDGKPAAAEIRLDGKALSTEQLGADSKLVGDKSIVEINWPFIFNVARSQNAEMHEIEIIPRSENFMFYTFVFG